MLFISSLSAFTFARMRFLGREVLFMAVIIVMMIPGVLTLVPSYMLYKSFGLLNSYLVLIIPIIVGGPVFGTFLLRAFFQAIPEDIFDAAKIDGCTDFQLYYKVGLPLCMPILGTLTIMQVMGTWNDYIWPMITIQNEKFLTISAGLILQFTKVYSNAYTLSFAGYMLASLPLIFLFIFANRYYIQGLTTSALKL
jgi:ABC-type glycerol-3-phosphate transport system permease component